MTKKDEGREQSPGASNQISQSESSISREDLQASLEWVDSLQVKLSPEFANMTTKEAKQAKYKAN